MSSQSERHIQNSNTDAPIDLEPSLQKGRAGRAEPKLQPSRVAEGSYPLGMVLSACPDIVDYAEGRDFELARFPGHRGRCEIDAGDQSERLGGGANRPGRNAGGGRRRMHPAAWHRDQISWRLLARADPESGGRGIFPWADPDVADQFSASRKATGLSDVKTGAVAGSGLSGRGEVVWSIPGDVADLA